MLPGSGVGRKISPLEMEALALAPFPSAERFTPFLITTVMSVIAELPMLLASEPLRPVKFAVRVSLNRPREPTWVKFSKFRVPLSRLVPPLK